ncbi:alpha-L-fucosidase [bacterium]|nr:alpha-L-fucosidase [bacterium]
MDKMLWFREAKFGMFIHWGLYAIPAGVWKDKTIPGIGEWIMFSARIPIKEYEKLAEQFNPVRFNAEEWVSIAKQAGMRYMVITAKHHDGFCMFDTKYTDYNIVKATPFKRDPIKELSQACQKEGIRFGVYYSQTLDWHHPDGMGNDWDFHPGKKDFTKYLREYVKPQLEELLTNYAPLALIWFDIGTPTPELARELREFVLSISPETIISGRIGHNLGDYQEMGDNEIPQTIVPGDWATPATINDTWGYKSYDHNWKSTGQLIYNLVDIVSKGGNYLLNVGPTAEGIIPEPSVVRLKEMGEWLWLNGESIYGCERSPLPLEKLWWGKCTAKGNKIYLHIFAWPWYGKLEIPDFPREVKKAYPLLTKENLSFKQDGNNLVLTLPSKPIDSIDTVIVLET